MATTTTDDWTTAPYAEWLEQSIQELVNANPQAIAMEMVGEDGLVSTCYYNTSPNDRACMIDAMRDDARFEFIKGTGTRCAQSFRMTMLTRKMTRLRERTR